MFSDSALPTLDVEMINTLRGTGIQVELHEVKMMTLIIANNCDWRIDDCDKGMEYSIFRSFLSSILLKGSYRISP